MANLDNGLLGGVIWQQKTLHPRVFANPRVACMLSHEKSMQRARV